MALYDISLPISADIPVWPGDPPVSLTRPKSIVKGDPCNVTQILMGAHTGTHIDAPNHFFKEGASVDSVALETLIGPCLVIECRGGAVIGKKDLQPFHIGAYSRILIKTRNSDLWLHDEKSFTADYVSLGIDAAQFLVEQGVALVGIDYLSVEAFHSEGAPVHELLLQNNVIILEGLNLSGITPGEYELMCLPLRLQGCEGAPARACLRREEK